MGASAAPDADRTLDEARKSAKDVATQAGFEPATPSSGGWCSIQLSYWATKVVGRTGLEPVTSAV